MMIINCWRFIIGFENTEMRINQSALYLGGIFICFYRRRLKRNPHETFDRYDAVDHFDICIL